MDFGLSEQQKMLQQSARAFLQKEVPSSLVKEMAEQKRTHDPELWRKMAAMGWMAMVVPEEYDGCEMTFLDLIVLLEEMGRAALPGAYFATAVLGALTILEAGSDEQKRRLLPGIATGETLLTVATAELEATCNPEFFRTEATPIAGGFKLSGTKLFVPDAIVADYIICAAHVSGATTLFLVKNGSPGLDCKELSTMAGDQQCEVRFEEVLVPDNNVVGEIGRGWQYWEKVLAKAAVAKCAEMVGGAQRVLELTVSHVKDRIQFGRPIGSFQAIQHHCANMLADVESSRVLTYQAAYMLAEGMNCAKEVAMAKAMAGQACRRVSTHGIQAHGGIGWSWEHDAHLYLKQAKLGEVSFGDAPFHEEIIAREIGL